MAGLAGARALRVIGVGDLEANEWGVGPIAEGVDFIALSCEILGQTSRGRAALFGRARCQIPGRELSWSAYCREMGWGRKAADRAADEACDKLAAEFNALGITYVKIPIDSAQSRLSFLSRKGRTGAGG
jgi:hypothetical protein